MLCFHYFDRFSRACIPAGVQFFLNTKSKEVINISKKEMRWKRQASLGHWQTSVMKLFCENKVGFRTLSDIFDEGVLYFRKKTPSQMLDRDLNTPQGNIWRLKVVGKYFFHISNRNTRRRSRICSKFKVKIPDVILVL